MCGILQENMVVFVTVVIVVIVVIVVVDVGIEDVYPPILDGSGRLQLLQVQIILMLVLVLEARR